MIETYEVLFDSSVYGDGCIVELQALSAQNAVDMVRKLYDYELKIRSVRQYCEDWK